MKKDLQVFAAVHLGSEAISMQIIEYNNLEKIKLLETVTHQVKLGEETFKNKRISFATVSAICEVLKGYRRLMEDYGVIDYSVQATTAVREAENQLYFLDQVYIKAGMLVEVVDMPREIYTKYIAIQRTLTKESITSDSCGMLLVDISSGGLGITYVRDGKIKYQQNLHIGIIRIKEDFDRNQRSNIHFNEVLTQFISSTIGPVREALENETIKYLVLSGTETELVLKMVGRSGQEPRVEHMNALDFIAFYDKVRSLNLSQMIQIYGIEETSAELIIPTIILYQQLLALVPAQEIIITPDHFIDGMKLLHIIKQTNTDYSEKLQKELLSLVQCVAERYEYDAQHAKQVEKISLSFFDRLAKIHDLTYHERLLLRAACILHDIGKYVCLRSHSLYSYQLIMSTDLMGFSDEDKKIIALTAYYHSHYLYRSNGEGQPTVEKRLVPIVSKLAAILRMADALDRSYKQKIKKCKLSIKGDNLLVAAYSNEALELEEWTFANKANFFVEVFGLKPILERVSG